MFGCADNIQKFLKGSMEKWQCELVCNEEVLGDVPIRRGIFQGDSLSPLLFVLCLIPLTLVLRSVKAGYSFKSKGVMVNHLLFMDDLKLFCKSNRQIEVLVNTVHIVSEDIGMEFGIGKCGVLSMVRGKVQEHEGIVMPGGEVMRSVEEVGYKYLGILEFDQIMEKEMKEKTRREYFRRLKLVLKSKLNGKNKIMGINAWAVAVIRYGGGVLNWRDGELKAIDRKTRKFLTMFGALHPKSDVDRLYLTRKRGGRGLIACERCIKSELNSLGWYIKHSVEPLLEEVKRSKVIEADGCMGKAEFKKKELEQVEENWWGKKMHGQYCREVSDEGDIARTWKWLTSSDLKPETEALICAAQEQTLRMNYVKCKIDKSVESPLCRLCREKGESVSHIVSECKKLAQKEYKKRHDNVARYIHWLLLGKYSLERSEKWYEHEPDRVVESNVVKILWDFMIQCDRYIEHRKPDILVVDKLARKCVIIDIAIPGDSRILKKEEEKLRSMKI
jgi:hypothetical protein